MMEVQPGMSVYVPNNQQLWVKATIQTVLDAKTCIVITEHDQTSEKCSTSTLLPCSDQDVVKVCNLTELSPINKASVIICLDERYKMCMYYTHAGSTIVAVNPFREVLHLYSSDIVYSYHAEQKLEPHIYQIGFQAYKRMCLELGHHNQTIIVSGESGSGKTVSAKHLLRYMTMASNSSRDEATPRHSPQGQCVERRLLDSNPVLEAFGNAVTQRNNNSSRFGKFIKLQFSRDGQMVGGQIQTYLLEKTRVVHQLSGECNFHIFYQLLKSIRESPDTSLCQLIEEIGEDGMKGVPQHKDIMNNRELTETLDAMTEIGLTQENQDDIMKCTTENIRLLTQTLDAVIETPDPMAQVVLTQENWDDIMKVLVAILFLCNMEFTPLEEESCEISSNKVSHQSLDQASDLLGIQPSQIQQALLYRNITSGGDSRRSIFVKPVPQREAYSRRDCLATLLYSRLFTWLVDYINSQIEAENCHSSIGLLDIYGFEAFETNSLEQLCINYANEKLQQHYVQHFMKDLQREYEEECIDWVRLDYTDNKPCLDILEGQPSVLGLLNEEVQLNRKTDTRQLCERILQLSQHAKHYIIKPKSFMKCPAFTINHYAGHVTYDGEGLATKNKDNIPQELIDILKGSTNQFISNLFEDYTVDSASGRKRKTVLGKFKNSLDQLLFSIHSSDVHYIRCIKPNTSFKPGILDRHYVMEQLVAGGIVETIEISCRGYPIRMPYGEFLHRYGMILRNSSSPENSRTSDNKDNDVLYEPLDLLYKKQLDMVPQSPRRSTTPKKRLRRRAGLSSSDHTRRCCAAVLKVHFDNCEGLTKQFGKTKLFMYQNQVDSLETRRLEILNEKAKQIQATWRRFMFQRHLKRKRREKRAVLVIQKYWRHYLQLKQYRAAVLVQKTFRMHSAKKKVLKMKDEASQQNKRKKRSWRTIIDRSGSSRSSSRRSTRSSGRRSDSSLEGLGKSWSSNASDMSENSPLASKSLELVTTEFKTSTPITDVRTSTSRKRNSDRKLQTMVKGRPNFVSEAGKKYTYTRSHGAPFTAIDNITKTDTDVPPIKKQKTLQGFNATQMDLSLGDGIITRRRLPKVPIKFHTRPSVLKNAHFIHQRELACGLEDCLPEKQDKLTQS